GTFAARRLTVGLRRAANHRLAVGFRPFRHPAFFPLLVRRAGAPKTSSQGRAPTLRSTLKLAVRQAWKAPLPNTMAATNKYLAQSNKSCTGGESTKKRETATNADPLLCPMKPTTKIRFTESQIALVMRAYPNCNLDRLTEVSFEFDQAGKIIDCVGTIKAGGNIDHDYTDSGLACLYERARRQLAARQTSATILQFPDGERLAKYIA